MKPGDWIGAHMGKIFLGTWYMDKTGRIWYLSNFVSLGMTYEERFGRSGN